MKTIAIRALATASLGLFSLFAPSFAGVTTSPLCELRRRGERAQRRGAAL